METKELKSRFVKYILKKYTKMYKLWLSMSDVFAEPRIFYKIGKWRSDPCLPVWRRAGSIKIFRKQIDLPIWLAFYIFNHEVWWKTKFGDDDFRYEYPGSFTIVAFGLSLSFWTKAPAIYIDKKDVWMPADDAYWENMLLCRYKQSDIYDYMPHCGYYTDKDHNQIFSFRPEFAKDSEYVKAYIKSHDYI